MKANRSNRDKMLRVRLTPHESTKLENFAARHGVTVSHVIREYIRRLPNSKNELSSLDGYEEINESLQINEAEQNTSPVGVN